MSLEPGARFADRYEIARRLGTGRMGTVYLARHLHMDRPSAIKVLGPEASRDPEALERFTREARNASRISHPNVCAVYDFGTTPTGMVYLAMECVEGRSLGALLLEEGRLAPRRAAALLSEIAAGLDAAHDLGIVHRDLKPDNVMVTTVRDRETVKLVDFGIANALNRALNFMNPPNSKRALPFGENDDLCSQKLQPLSRQLQLVFNCCLLAIPGLYEGPRGGTA